MIHELFTLRPIDQVLVVGFAIYAIFIIVALIATDWEIILRDIRRMINGLILKIEVLNAKLHSDEEEFCPEWMDWAKYQEAMRK